MQKLKNPKNRGKFVVLYGPNNIGKTTQKHLLVGALSSTYHEVTTLKYPLYTCEPTGPRINGILRNPNHPERNMDEFEFQKLCAQNRRDFEPTLIYLLNSNFQIIAEDYVGTSIAWGMTKGAKYEELLKVNQDLIKPDLAILMDGERFNDGKENGHRNEEESTKVWQKNREIHLDLAEKFGWIIVDANQSITEVHQSILQVVGTIYKN